MNKKVLVICFSFPPNKEIGGRRWTFYSKYLEINSVDVHVLASDYGIAQEDESPWLKEIDLYEHKITRIPHRIPFHIKNKTPSSTIDRIKYKWSEIIAKIGKNKNPYDRSIKFGGLARSEAKRLVLKHDIENIIVSGGPYDFLHEIAKLKEELKNRINLIVDLRDPWTEKYGQELFEDEFKIAERRKNEFVLKMADRVFVPTVGILEGMKTFWSLYSSKIVLIPHGYDDNLFDKLTFEKGSFDKWFYAGTLYPKMNNEVNLLQSLLEKSNSKLDIFTFYKENDYGIFSDSNCHYNDVLSQKELFLKTSDSGIALLLYPEFQKNNRTSKFYELVKARKFLLYIGPMGLVSEFIKEQQLGFVIDSGNTDSISEEILFELKDAFKKFACNSEFIESYSMLNIAKNIKEELV